MLTFRSSLLALDPSGPVAAARRVWSASCYFSLAALLAAPAGGCPSLPPFTPPEPVFYVVAMKFGLVLVSQGGLSVKPAWTFSSTG